MPKKPKPVGAAMMKNWDVDEEAIFANSRVQIEAYQRELRLGRWARWVGLFAFGLAVGLAIGAVGAPLTGVLAASKGVLGALGLLTWLALDRAAARAKNYESEQLSFATQDLKYVPPPADEDAGHVGFPGEIR